MLEQIYLKRRDVIDHIIMQAIKKVENKIKKIDNQEAEKNKELLDKIEENYNIKLGSICKEVYLQGLKDGINLMLEVKEK